MYYENNKQTRTHVWYNSTECMTLAKMIALKQHKLRHKIENLNQNKIKAKIKQQPDSSLDFLMAAWTLWTVTVAKTTDLTHFKLNFPNRKTKANVARRVTF